MLCAEAELFCSRGVLCRTRNDHRAAMHSREATVAQPSPRETAGAAHRPTSELIRANSGGMMRRCQHQQKEDEGIEDEDEGAGMPARIEREERSQTVVVGVVQQQMAEQRKQRKAVQQTPTHGSLGQWRW